MPYDRHGKFYRTLTTKKRRRRAVRTRIPRKLQGYVRTGGNYGRYSSGLEMKFKDTTIDDAVIASAGTINPGPIIIAQGTTESTRIGRKITVFKWHVKWQLTLPAQTDVADIDNGDTMRIMWIVDRQANGAYPAVLDVLETAAYDSFRNLANTSRFRVLSDVNMTLRRLVSMTDGANTANSPGVRTKVMAKSFSLNMPVEYDSTTGAITEIRSFNLFVLAISQMGLGGLLTNNRVRFKG